MKHLFLAEKQPRERIAKVIRTPRVARRTVLAVAAAPMAVGLTMLQGFVVGPLFNNYSLIPNLIFAMARRILGLKVIVNESLAPIVKDKPVFFVSNHITAEDAVVLGGKLNGAFVGKAEVTKWPIFGQMLRAVKFIPVRRKAVYNAEARGQIIRHLNEGSNIIMFPEATTSQSRELHMFRAGLVTALFDGVGTDKNGAQISLQKNVVVQPVALSVKAVNGKEITPDDPRRSFYAISRRGHSITPTFKLMSAKNITLELTVLPPLDPANFDDAKGLINQAALDVASIVNPGQTVFKKAKVSTKL